MPSRERKSKAVRLVLMGSAVGVLSGCAQDVQRNSYASLADCVADYSAAQCRQDAPVGSSSGYYGAGGYHYYGPWYRSNFRSGSPGDSSDPGPGRFARSGASGFGAGSTAHGPSGVEMGSRGGFGAHGRVAARGS